MGHALSDGFAPQAYWGGEPAAEKLTQYLKPAQFTIYTRDPITRLVAAGRMRAAENGNVEILQKSWNFGGDPNAPDLVPPVLVYADPVATNDSRNRFRQTHPASSARRPAAGH